MRYQVIITLSEPVTPPYSEWLTSHVDEMLSLKNEQGEALFTSADVVEQGNQFTVTYQTTNEHFAYYEATHADAMRSAFKETYHSQISAFAFARKTIEE